MKIDLTGKVAVVTGATGELGRVIARTFADCGASVAMCYHADRERAEQLKSDLQARGVRAMTIQADVTDKASVVAMREGVARTLGDADIIVNGAVIQYPWTTVLEQDAKDYESQFRSCVLHNVFMAQAFVPRMIEKRWGRIIAINTECSLLSGPTQSAYVSGKRGMDGVLRVLAREIGEYGITVNQVAPGWMISDRSRADGTERQPAYEAAIPLRHRGEDQDVANAVAFLASDLARFITGVFLPVCGGNAMPCI